MGALCSLAVFLHLSLSIFVPGGYSVGPLLLLLGALVALIARERLPRLSTADLAIIAAFLLYFLLHMVLNLLHGWESSEMDRPARFVIAAAVLPFLLRHRSASEVFWLGIALTAIALGLYAVWYKLYLLVPRVRTDINAIYFGNISIVLSLMSVPGILWASERRDSRFWTILLLVGFGMGLMASLFSGTRGAWITLPIAAPIFAVMLLPQLSRAALVWLVILFGSTLTLAYLLPQTGVKNRIEAAEAEVVAYFQDGKNTTSTGLRLDMWRASLLAFQESPLIGLGKQGYKRFQQRLIHEGTVTPGIGRFKDLHNQYFEELAKRGIVGFLGLVIVFLVPLGCFCIRARHPSASVRSFAYAGLLFVVAYMIFNVTNSILSRNPGVMIYAFLTVIIWSMTSMRSTKGGID